MSILSRRNIYYCLIWLAALAVPAFSQTKGVGENPAFDLQKELQTLTPTDMQGQNEYPVSSYINPAKYRLGPGDVLFYFIFPIDPAGKQIIVNADNTVIFPRIGSINVNGKTLTQLQDTLASIYKERNPDARVSLSIKRPRVCFVTISGNILFPSSYTLPANYRVSTLYELANQMQQNQILDVNRVQSIIRKREEQNIMTQRFEEQGIASNAVYHTRNIKVLHIDGSSNDVDFEKAAAMNDPDFDPYLREGDRVIVPFEKEEFPIISIYGAVTRPHIAHFKSGDKASMLLKFGYGGTEDVDTTNVMLTLPVSAKQIYLNVDRHLNLLGQDYELEPGSLILVGRIKGIEERPGIVTVKGEVEKPGIFLITPGMRLKDAVSAAGGFKPHASLSLAHIVRDELQDNSAKNYLDEAKRTYQYSDLKLEDTVRFFYDVNFSKPYVACDFVAAYSTSNKPDSIKAAEINNIPIQDRDIIVVPRNPGRVYIFGQIANPGYIEFVPNQTIDWYIARAGGGAPSSETDRARIIRGRTEVWLEGKEGVYVQDGDKIYVPRVPDEPAYMKLQRMGVWIGILGATVGLLQLLLNVYNSNK
ncbi:MAG: SLBB domain-containing protein [Chloroflexota bacterium]